MNPDDHAVACRWGIIALILASVGLLVIEKIFT